ncbi:cytochrome P450 [Lepidopterella palustris CBS 459.81]|uniref:Cytochrome P450 n=1 Tax=Lepidopterella palustris CBS 459.81 TaxID=1314670 RepID=A0A8E2DX50_9PEZI|nr:cytochrome P450 [Lepidopterella palustris CBS 459.81]
MWESYLLSANLAYVAAFILIGSYVQHVLFNLYRHPLAHIPGPKIAAATYLYQTYYSLVGGSRYYIKIGKLHDKYGPVVRITPDEVHLSNPENYDIINHVGTKYAKSAQFYDAFGIGYSTFSSSPNDLHRIRRSGLNPFFSRKMVLELEDVVQSKAEKLCQLLAKKFSKGESVDLHHGLRAVSVDVFTEYAFGNCYNLLDRPNLGLDFFAMVQGIGPMMWIFFQWPLLQKLLLSIPPAIAMRMSPPLKQVLSLQAASLTL